MLVVLLRQREQAPEAVLRPLDLHGFSSESEINQARIDIRHTVG